MAKRARLFMGGFFITAIALGALWGFSVVDMRTDRYMPGTFAPIMQLTQWDSEGAAFAWMGVEYYVELAPVLGGLESLETYAGLLPSGLHRAAAATTLLCQWAQEQWEAAKGGAAAGEISAEQGQDRTFSTARQAQRTTIARCFAAHKGKAVGKALNLPL